MPSNQLALRLLKVAFLFFFDNKDENLSFFIYIEEWNCPPLSLLVENKSYHKSQGLRGIQIHPRHDVDLILFQDVGAMHLARLDPWWVH